MIKGAPAENRLDPSLWTILPGNHDITTERKTGGSIRHNLGMFFHFFADAYDGTRSSYDDTFPFRRNLGGKNEGIKVRLICLDSNVEWPVWVVGLNARGRIDNAQFEEFARKLSEANNNELVIVALHHHPIVVPEMISNSEDYFLSLDESVGRRFVALCATNGVAAILHGHFHKFSIWSGQVPEGTRSMQIIGSPAGSMNIPNVSEEFLELREASLNDRRGLALYSHFYEKDKWMEKYRTFIG
jgi:3',5'-cyclic AMP phosphodiesterase CpdA